MLLGEQGAVHGARRRRRWRSTCRRSPPPPRARSASGWQSDGVGLPGGAGLRLAAEGRGRHAHDHGRRRARATSSARGRCSRRWASCIVHVGPARARAAGQAAHEHDGRGPRRGAGGVRARRSSARAWTRTPSSRWPPGAPGNSTVLGPEGPADVRARLQPALQARAHAQGRPPLPGRGAGARAWSCGSARWWSRSTRRPPRTATARRTSRAVARSPGNPRVNRTSRDFP